MNEHIETLFAYQKEGAKWLATKKFALLGDDMGLGKSAQAIVASDVLNLNRICVLCPAIARFNWLREFQKFSSLSRQFDIVLSKQYKPNLTKSIICSYDLATHFSSDSFGEFDLLILDESHYLKEIKTKRTQNILGRQGYVRKAKKIWCLSGTPAPNHAGELWPILYTFGFVSEPYERFLEKYCEFRETSYGRQITGTKRSAIPELRDVLKRVMLRRRTQDVLKQLPELFFQDLFVEPGVVDLEVDSSFVQYVFPIHREHELKELLEKELKLIEATTSHTGFGREGMKILEGLAKSVSTLRRYTGLQKVESVANLVKEELELGIYDKIVLFAIHRDVIEGLKKRLHDFGAVTLYGGTPPEKRQRHIDKFQKNPRCRVFIGNIQASGTAITLTASNHVIFVEQDWVPGNNAQAAKRCHRIGQTKPVFVRIAALADSYDERLSAILKRKTKELLEIFDKNSLQQMTAQNIFKTQNEN